MQQNGLAKPDSPSSGRIILFAEHKGVGNTVQGGQTLVRSRQPPSKPSYGWRFGRQGGQQMPDPSGEHHW